MERLVAAPTIRAATAADLDALERLENEAFTSDRLSRRSLRYFLHAARTTDVPVATDATGLLGYAMVGFRAGSDIGRIFSLAVHARAGRRGIGRALLRACEAAAVRRGRERLRLEVRADNAAAIALYDREGFSRLGLETEYYEDGSAALKLEKRVAP